VLPARNITIRPGMASYYSQFFDISKLPGYASVTFDNPRSQLGSIGIERQLAPTLFVSVDYTKQHWTGLDRSVDLNAPSVFVRTAPGQTRSVVAADATRPITPVNNGFRRITVIENLGVADYDGLQTMIRWQNSVAQFSASYTLSSNRNTVEPDGESTGPNDYNQLGAAFEQGPSLQGQRHRAVTGVDNNGDGQNYDRPVINGVVAGRNSFMGTPLYDTSVFLDGRIKWQSARTMTLRIEGFNIFDHANVLSRSGVYGNAAGPSASLGTPLTGMANLNAAREFQFQLRYTF
jgi:hypothetical protein